MSCVGCRQRLRWAVGSLKPQKATAETANLRFSSPLSAWLHLFRDADSKDIRNLLWSHHRTPRPVLGFELFFWDGKSQTQSHSPLKSFEQFTKKWEFPYAKYLKTIENHPQWGHSCLQFIWTWQQAPVQCLLHTLRNSPLTSDKGVVFRSWECETVGWKLVQAIP